VDVALRRVTLLIGVLVVLEFGALQLDKITIIK
jgi:hypothetical protein